MNELYRFQTCHPGKIEIDQQAIDGILVDHLQRLFTGGRSPDAIALSFKDLRQRCPQLRIVVRDEQGRRGNGVHRIRCDASQIAYSLYMNVINHPKNAIGVPERQAGNP
jgi:hypothetical protein